VNPCSVSQVPPPRRPRHHDPKINGHFESFRGNENSVTETSNLENFWWDKKCLKNGTNFLKRKPGEGMVVNQNVVLIL